MSPESAAAQYDAINKTDPKLQRQADALRAQHEATVNPVATAYDKLLANGAPQYQTPHMSPWLLALGAGLGALQNHVEPFNQTGAQDWVQAPLQGAFQPAQDQYHQAQEAYAQNLEGAQARYALAKDRNQTLLDQADAIDKQIADQARDRRQFVATAVLQSAGQNFELARQELGGWTQRQMQESQQNFQRQLQQDEFEHQSHRSQIDYYTRKGNKMALADLYVADYMHGRPHDESGLPILPEDRQAVDQIRKHLMQESPEDIRDALQQRIDEEHFKQQQLITRRMQTEMEQGYRDLARLGVRQPAPDGGPPAQSRPHGARSFRPMPGTPGTFQTPGGTTFHIGE